MLRGSQSAARRGRLALCASDSPTRLDGLDTGTRGLWADQARTGGGSHGHAWGDPGGHQSGSIGGRVRDPCGWRRLRLEHDPRGDSAGIDVGDRFVDLVERSGFADHAGLAGGVQFEHLA